MLDSRKRACVPTETKRVDSNQQMPSGKGWRGAVSANREQSLKES